MARHSERSGPVAATTFVDAPWRSPWSVRSELVEGPTEEPLTLDQGKVRAGLDWPSGDPRDELMTGFIAAARAKVELDTGLALLKQTRRISVSMPTTGVVPMPAQALPLLSIVDEWTGEPVAAAVTGQVLPGRPRVVGPTLAPRVVLDASRNTVLVSEGDWTFLIESGWPDAVALAAEAPLLLHAVGLMVAHMATMGRDVVTADSVFEVPYGYEAAIAPYRLVWVI
jgi:uncharacterized phiE125 gp8 family phage protein